MWTSSRWSKDIKWAVSGIFFPPLWSMLIWRLGWPVAARLGSIAAIILGTLVLAGHFGGPSAVIGAIVATMLFLLLWAQSANRSEPPAVGEPQTRATLRRIIESKLDTCHDLIAQVEDSVQLRMLPTDSPAVRQYRHALEMRAEGLQLFEQARSQPDLVAADERITRALDRLRVARDGIIEG